MTLLKQLQLQHELAFQPRQDYPSDLRVQTTEIAARSTLENIRKALTKRGFIYYRSLQSAMYNVDFYPEKAKGLSERERRQQRIRPIYTIDGWHGTGKGNRHYGDSFTIFAAYMDRQKTATILNVGDIDFVGNAAYFTTLEKKHSYLRELGRMEEAFVSGRIVEWFKS